MDDSTFIAPSKHAMSQKLQIADSFNALTGILVNANKSELIVINSDNDINSIKYGNNEYEIIAKRADEPIRFLGVWISGQKNDRFIMNQVKGEVNLAVNRLKRKRITSQQIVYVFNAVIVPRIEYRCNLSAFTEKKCEKLQVPIRQLLRHKSGLVNTLPNCFLWIKEGYGLIDIFNRIIENQTANLLVCLNDTGILGDLMAIRVAQLQLNEWLPFNPLTNWPYFNPTDFKSCLIAQILSILNNWEINIEWFGDRILDLQGKVPLCNLLNNLNYRKYKDSLRAKGLMFLDQLREGDFLLQWDQLHAKVKFSQQGVIPRWWSEIEKTVLIPNSRIIDGRFKNLNDEVYRIKYDRLLPYTKIDRRKNNWIIVKNNSDNISKQVKIGLLLNNSWNPGQRDIKIIHYRFKSRDTSNLTVFKCKQSKCDYGLMDDNGNCVITCNRLESLKINDKLVKLNDNEFILKQSYYTLLHEINLLNRNNNELDIQAIVLDDRQERSFFLQYIFETSSQVVNELLNIYDRIINSQNNVWKGYTDGSLSRYQINENDKLEYKEMGFGWLILKDNESTPIAKFFKSSIGWPSSTRIELLAVVSIVSVFKKNSNITL